MAASTAANLLAAHVKFRLSCADRVICNGWVQGLQTEGQVVRFLAHRGYKPPSPTGFRTIHERLVDDINALASGLGLQVRRFPKGAKKEEIARPYIEAAEKASRPGVVFIGNAQELMPGGWRCFHDPAKPQAHFSCSRQPLYVDHYYFYFFDDEWGPCFIKMAPFAPFPLWCWCNGHEWLKRQLNKLGSPYQPLDNGLRQAEDPALASRVAARLSAAHFLALFHRLSSALPSPLTPADAEAGFAYSWSFRQVEFSDTATFDRPAAGRAFFEQAIKEHLDLGRPDKASIVFGRRVSARTPGPFQTKLITVGTDPSIYIYYRSSKAKAYFKAQRALRVETTINNPKDFGVRKTVNADNWRSLRQIGQEVNGRFLAVLGEGARVAPDAATVQEVVMPSTDADGLRAPGLRFGEPRAMALLAATAAFAHVLPGLTNTSLRNLVAGLLPGPYTCRQATYDLRRLRRKGLVERVPGRNTYHVTPKGRAVATLFTKVAGRVLAPLLTELETPLPPTAPAPRPIVVAWRNWQRELDNFIAAANVV